MKKIFSYLILLALPLLVFSCRSKAPETPVSKMKSVLYTSIPASSEVIELLAGKSKTVDVNVCAEAVSDVYMTMTFKVDPEAVASYNSKNGTNYEILPSSAFTFTKGEVMLPRFHDAIKPVMEWLYYSVQTGNEAQITIDANSKPDYRAGLEKELEAMRNQEMWRAGETVRKLRPENQEL